MTCAVTGESLHIQYGSALEAFTARLAPGWRASVRRDGAISWQVCESGDELPGQGWKLHVAAAPTDALDLLEVVLPELVKSGATFKLAADVDTMVRINAGLAGASQVGKIVTVYPAAKDTLPGLIDRLDRLWRPDRAPAITSDLPVGSGGALFIRYGAFQAASVVTDSVGVPRTALRAPDGTLYPDVRDTKGWQPDWAVPPVPPVALSSTANASAPIEIDGTAFLPMKVLAANLLGHVALALRISDRRLVIIRHRVRGVESDELGNDARTRLDNEKRALLHLEGSRIAPEVVAHDLPGGNLVVSDAGGIRPEHLPAQDRLKHLPELAVTVAKLHARGIVHRDLKLSNVRIGPDGLRLVDLELAALIGTEHPVPAGTLGYVPPEGRHAVADPSYDVYGLGSCVTHAVMGHCPGHLPPQNNAGRQLGLLRQHMRPTAASIVKACHEPDPLRRPTAQQVAERLQTALPAMRAESSADLDTRHGVFDRRWACSAAMSAGTATRQFTVARGGAQHWRNAHLLAAYDCEGLNLGAAGIIIALATLDAALGTQHFTDDIALAAEWLAARPPLTQAQGFFTGNSGVSVALAVAGKRLCRAELIDSARRRFEHAAYSRIPDYDLFSGAAGIVWAGSLLDAVLGSSWGRSLAEQQVMRVRAGARLVDGLVGWLPNPEFDPSGRVYVGAAHGTAGVGMALAVWGRSTGCTATRDLADEALGSVPDHGLTADKANILTTTSGDISAAHHWCHGVAGFLWCLLQASPDPGIAVDAARQLAATAFDRATPVLDNPTMCHGLAGVMETWRMLGALPEHSGRARHRLAQTTNALRLLHRAQGGATVWSSENPSVVTPDLWVGFMGPATQLALASAGSAFAVLSPQWLRRCAAPALPGNRMARRISGQPRQEGE
ncbi:lanthionine synthetase LanC family protein [Streptomyces sp. NPDC060020]|uniref:class III lanthionine synthetase LanKC N-terminal domain-containing protein n=1 Tax=Streptomyces sp. NPDC060020 TaxID=3347038 RepID=UPI00368B06A6